MKKQNWVLAGVVAMMSFGVGLLAHAELNGQNNANLRECWCTQCNDFIPCSAMETPTRASTVQSSMPSGSGNAMDANPNKR